MKQGAPPEACLTDWPSKNQPALPRSNRESGYGRYDIMLRPKTGRGIGIIIEFKLVESAGEDAFERVLDEALAQIAARGYAAELNAAGVSDILEIAVAFRGKELRVKHRRSGRADPEAVLQ